MGQFQKDIRLLHPILRSNLDAIIARIQSEIPNNLTVKMISAHRTPEEQFELFKQGRKHVLGVWVIKNKNEVVTYKDGFKKVSNHNYLPCLSMDFGIFNGTKYLTESPAYNKIGLGKQVTELIWGGDWNDFTDKPHLEVPVSRLFRKNVNLDTNLQWQRYLRMSGEYTGAMDGMFGNQSKAALKVVTGSNSQTVNAWRELFDKFGILPESD